jgi:hypothetical protein
MVEIKGQIGNSTPEEKGKGILRLILDHKESTKIREYIQNKKITTGQMLCIDIGKEIKHRRSGAQEKLFYTLAYKIAKAANTETKTIRDLVIAKHGPKVNVIIGEEEYIVPKPIRLLDKKEMSWIISRLQIMGNKLGIKCELREPEGGTLWVTK